MDGLAKGDLVAETNSALSLRRIVRLIFARHLTLQHTSPLLAALLVPPFTFLMYFCGLS